MFLNLNVKPAPLEHRQDMPAEVLATIPEVAAVLKVPAETVFAYYPPKDEPCLSHSAGTPERPSS